METTYALIPDFPGYRARSDGTVWTCWRLRGRSDGSPGTESYMSNSWKQMSPGQIKTGRNGNYLYLRIKNSAGKVKTKLVHCLVLEAFIGPCPVGMECRHYPDPNKQNNNKDNLSWATAKQNSADRIEHGTQVYEHENRPRGEAVALSKLSENEVRCIRADHAGDSSRGWQSRLSRKYKVSRPVIVGIVERRHWKHIV